MAFLKSGSYKASGTVYLDYELYADQVGASGNNRTVRVTAKFKCGGNPAYPSWWGYAMSWRPYVNSTYGSWASVKGTESWNTNSGWTSRSQDITVNVGTSSATNVTVGFSTDSTGDNGWDGGASASFGVGSTNTAPWFQAVDYLTFRENNSSGNVITQAQNGTENAVKISENIASIYISWPTAYDNEGGTITYEIWGRSNESAWSKIADTGTNRYYTHNIGTGNEGRSYDYYVKAKDSAGLVSGNCNGTQFQKNTFTMDSFASSYTGIDYSGKPIPFSFSGATNTQSGVSLTRTITCDNGITIHNNTLTADHVTAKAVTVNLNWGQEGGNVGPYINWSDIVSKFSSSSGKGTLNFTLSTKNSNGTTKTASKAISVNIQTAPNGVGFGTGYGISLVQSESTNYRSTTVNSNAKYFIPDGSLFTRVKWTAGSGKVGDGVKYKVYVAYGSGGWEFLADVPSGTHYYNHSVPRQTESRAFQYMVRTISTFNESLYTDTVCTAQTMHYYNAPGLTESNITRTETTANVDIVINTITSIPNVKITGTWSCKTSAGVAVGTSKNLATEPGLQTLSLTGLSGNTSYLVSVVYNDNSGLTTNDLKPPAIAISVNLPVFFINKYGVGVGGVQADAYNALNVNGSIVSNGLLDVNNILTNGFTSNSLSVANNALNVSEGKVAIGKVSELENIFDVNMWSLFRNGVEVNGSLWCRGQWFNADNVDIDNLRRPIILPDKSDLNNIQTPGRYVAVSNASASTMLNCPVGSAFTMNVKRINGGFVQQEFSVYHGSSIFIRSFYDWDNTWGSWVQFRGQKPIGFYNTQNANDQARVDIKLENVNGAYLVVLEYNQNPGGSSAYWTSCTAIVNNGVGWNGSALVDRLSFTTLSVGGGITSIAGLDFNWNTTGTKDKVVNSEATLRMTFTKNASHHINNVVRGVKVVRLLEI